MQLSPVSLISSTVGLMVLKALKRLKKKQYTKTLTMLTSFVDLFEQVETGVLVWAGR